MTTDAEIAVLEALAAQGEILEAKTGASTPPFRSRLRLVDRQRRLLLFDRSIDQAADKALLALPHARLQIKWGEWRVAFVAANPVSYSHEGSEAIRLDFPETVEIGRRRMHQRTPDPQPRLRCAAYVGDASVFDAVVTDLSRGGIGLEIDFTADELEPGTILAGYRLESQGREPVSVDLEVRHTTSEPHGPRILHAGCRFVNPSPAAMALIAAYTEVT